MKTKLQQFENEEFGKIRALEIDGLPWLVGKDVAAALGYERPTKAVQDHVDAEDKDGIPIQDSIGRMQNTPVINESGLYSLILSSKLSTAKKFKRWVTSEVLPSIRKHGAYIDPELLEELARSREAAQEFFIRLQSEQQKTAILQDRMVELAPKARYCDIVLACRNVLPISVIAKDYGMSAAAFNRLLYSLSIQYKVGGTWVLYQRHANQGYTRTRTYPINQTEAAVHTYWTQKGRLFLYDFLKHYGILPLMEV